MAAGNTVATGSASINHIIANYANQAARPPGPDVSFPDLVTKGFEQAFSNAAAVRMIDVKYAQVRVSTAYASASRVLVFEWANGIPSYSYGGVCTVSVFLSLILDALSAKHY